MEHDGHSFGGGGISRLFRMLEARPLKRMLAGPDTELALMVSDDMYQSLVSRTPATASRDAFQRVRFQVKHTRTGGWTYLPDRGTVSAAVDAGTANLRPAARDPDSRWAASMLGDSGGGGIWKIKSGASESTAARTSSQLAGDRYRN